MVNIHMKCSKDVFPQSRSMELTTLRLLKLVILSALVTSSSSSAHSQSLLSQMLLQTIDCNRIYGCIKLIGKEVMLL